MSKHVIKASKLVSSAVSTFDNAINTVAQANQLISQGIDLDEKELASIEVQIKDLYTRLDVVQAARISKEGNLKTNMDLIMKLSQFTVGGSTNG